MATRTPNPLDVASRKENSQALELRKRIIPYVENHKLTFSMGNTVYFKDYPEALYIVTGINITERPNEYFYTLSDSQTINSNKIKAPEDKLVFLTGL